jgi:BCD family chlorophyll transporter-like MFS transporter
MMIISIIVMATIISQMVDPYTPEALQRVFWMVGIVAAVLGVLGLIGLEGPYTPGDQTEERHSWGQMYSAILNNKQASLFFVYLVLLLSAILGQDVLLEPYAAEAFGLSVEQTTRITSIWGTFFLITLIGAGPLQNRVDKKSMARIGAWLALVSFALIVLSGVLKLSSMFYVGVVLLGAGTGLSTVSNLSLMLDMTTVGNVGLFIGAWGVSSAVARLIGTMISGVVYDVVTAFANNDLVLGYIVVFGIEFLFLLTSVYLLRRVDVGTFREEAQEPMTFVERAALVGRAGD